MQLGNLVMWTFYPPKLGLTISFRRHGVGQGGGMGNYDLEAVGRAVSCSYESQMIEGLSS